MCIEQIARDLLASGKYSARQRQVETGSDLRHVGGGEVGRDPSRWELKSRVQQCGVNAVARLAHGSISESHDRKSR
jgi:hypothetical protein